jgi:hypothetical protein
VITVVKFLNLLYDGRVSKGTRVTKNAPISDVAQSCRHMILPERVFGSSIVNRAPEDLANPPSAKRDSLSIRVQARGWLYTSAKRDERDGHLPLMVTQRPMTATSATCGCSVSTLSNSIVMTRCPATSSTLSTLPTNQKSPSESLDAASPVKEKPSMGQSTSALTDHHHPGWFLTTKAMEE